MIPRSARLLPFLALIVPLARAQITTVAGVDWTFPVSPLPALQAPLGITAAVAADTAGNYYVADTSNNIIVKVNGAGTLSVVAGNGAAGYSGDNGPATAASLQGPSGIAVDTAGNLYIADTGNYRVRKVSVSGAITTVAGNGDYNSSGDNGPATSAALEAPTGVAVSGSDLFIADSEGNVIRKVDGSGVITTVAGNGAYGYSGDNGPATSAELRYPYGIAVDGLGNLFIADAYNAAIRRVSADGTITTVAGGAVGYSGDHGPATGAALDTPCGIALDGAGDLLIADTYNSVIRKVDSSGVITTVAGNTAYGYSGDGGQAAGASLNYPYGVAVDASGNLLVADWNNHRIRQVNAGGIITTIAGNGGYSYSGDGGPAASAALQLPGGVFVDAADNVYIADTSNHRIRSITPAGIINTVAGAGIPAYSGDNGPAVSAFLNHPNSGAADAFGNLFIADSANNVIRKVTPAGIVTTVAGNGNGGYTGDNGPATSASLLFPEGVAIDASGNLFIADTYNSVIREVSNGTITTVAGNGVAGYSGDHGPATGAKLSYPAGLAVDASGNLLIADSDNHAIRKVSGSIITTLAGNGVAGYWGDQGPAAGAQLDYPTGVALDVSGNLFIADSNNNAIRKISVGGIITTVAGTGDPGDTGDYGPATAATLNEPGGIAVDAACNLFIADTYNNRVRMVAGGGGVTVSPSAVVLDATAQSGPLLSVRASAPACAWASTSAANWITITSGATGAGNGTAGFAVQANSTGSVRTGAVHIGGETVPVTQRETQSEFADVTASDYYFDYANLLYQAGITYGCLAQPLDYCPDSDLTRGQMAALLIAAVEGGRSRSFTYTHDPYFTDVPPSNPYFSYIQKLKDMGITKGCTATAYCPDNPVTRGETAAFIIRARYGSIPFSYPGTPYFTDAPSSYLFFPMIQKMAQAGITSGCGPKLYCPDQNLTRGQMAVFVVTGLLNELLPPDTPFLASTTPNSAIAGQTITVTVTGVNTHFAQGSTQVAAPAGIAASSVAVASGTSLTVQLMLDPAVSSGPASLVVTTGAEEAVLPNGFIVQ